MKLTWSTAVEIELIILLRELLAAAVSAAIEFTGLYDTVRSLRLLRPGGFPGLWGVAPAIGVKLEGVMESN